MMTMSFLSLQYCFCCYSSLISRSSESQIPATKSILCSSTMLWTAYYVSALEMTSQAGPLRFRRVHSPENPQMSRPRSSKATRAQQHHHSTNQRKNHQTTTKITQNSPKKNERKKKGHKVLFWGSSIMLTGTQRSSVKSAEWKVLGWSRLPEAAKERLPEAISGGGRLPESVVVEEKSSSLVKSSRSSIRKKSDVCRPYKSIPSKFSPLE